MAALQSIPGQGRCGGGLVLGLGHETLIAE
jgi:hypothetical protein